MDNNKKQKLILASCSPRRRELIKLLGMDFECISVDADESTNETVPSKAVQEISAKKARAALSARKIARDEVIIGADTIVVFNEKLLGKPVGSDIAKGKMTLMVVKALAESEGEDHERLLEILKDENGKELQGKKRQYLYAYGCHSGNEQYDGCILC